MRTLFILLALVPSLFAQSEVSPASPYRQAVQALERFISEEVEQKRLPALSIALVDDQQIVWAKGFGYEDVAKKKKASADTVYRVGSVSKLFTDVAVMQLVEQGKLDLDAPVTKYLADFAPRPHPEAPKKPITLRQLMAHRSGLVREPPIGNYFDPDNLDLGKTVRSLNATTLVYPPEARTKYSNAGIALVGYVLQQTQGKPFARYLADSLLVSLGMTSSSFEPNETTQAKLASAMMWTYHGREFPAPTFELGMAPAGSMYSTVLDLSRFLKMCFGRGLIDGKRILQEKTLETMWTPQFTNNTQEGFGLGFSVTRWKDRRRIGHGGAIYGFATDLSALPEDKLGVVVVNSCDCANSVSTRIADVALEHMLAVKQKSPLPTISKSQPLPEGQANRLAGRYTSGTVSFDLIASAGRLYWQPARGGFRVELRQAGKNLIADDRLGWGITFEPIEEGFRVGKTDFRRTDIKKPQPIPSHWQGLIGEYGWDHNKLFVFEKDGQLHVLIEWFFLYPLKEKTADVYLFPPDFGLYHGEKLIFSRDKTGRATQVEAASIVFQRRKLDGEDGSTFRLKPQQPIEKLRELASKAKPPSESGILFRDPELIDLATLDTTLKFDIRYASTNNFLSTQFYRTPKAFLQKPAAEALVRAHRRLEKLGYGLLIFDGYRPWSVTKMFWEATPPHFRVFVADPEQGSRHNRGCAVDLTLYDRKSGKAVEMVGGYDEMSDRSYPDYIGGTSLQRWHRDLLRRVMEAEGFTVYEAEWWHFDYKDWRKYPIGNLSFEEISR